VTRGVLAVFLRRELADMRANSRVWPVYVVLTLVAVGLPVLLAVLAPIMFQDAARTGDPALQAIVGLLGRLEEFRGYAPEEAMTRYMLRNAAGIFLLLPVALASTAAAFSIVGEKQQRTLEPILATPVTDTQFLLAKLLAAAGPTIAVSLVAGAFATGLAVAVTYPRYDTLLVPDRFWMLAVFVLPQLVTVAVTLVTMRLSARATDPQATIQSTALIVLPACLVILALFGRILTTVYPVLGAACALVAVLDVVLFRGNVRRFRREEILTRWR
jgi:ABC-2 type transport system permease protein